MSSDPFADLARTAGQLAAGIRTLLDGNQRPAAGSPAADDAVNDDLSSEWGRFPAQGVFGELLLTAWSCADHLAATAVVIRARASAAPLYTLMRAAAEAAASGCYLSGASIDDRERVRRYMNRRLTGLCEEISMVGSFPSPQAQAKAKHLESRIAVIGKSASQHGFDFRDRDRYRAAYIGEKPLQVMTLIDGCVPHAIDGRYLLSPAQRGGACAVARAGPVHDAD